MLTSLSGNKKTKRFINVPNLLKNNRINSLEFLVLECFLFFMLLCCINFLESSSVIGYGVCICRTVCNITYTTHIHVIITSSSFKYIFISWPSPAVGSFSCLGSRRQKKKKINTISAGANGTRARYRNRNWLEFHPPAPPLQASCARATCCLLPRFHLLTSFFFLILKREKK